MEEWCSGILVYCYIGEILGIGEAGWGGWWSGWVRVHPLLWSSYYFKVRSPFLFKSMIYQKQEILFFAKELKHEVCLAFSVDPWWVACALQVCSSSLRPPLALDKRIQRFTAKVSLCCKPPFKIGHEWKILILTLRICTDLYFQRNCLQKSQSQDLGHLGK